MIIALAVFCYVIIGLLVGGYAMSRLEANYDPDADWGAGLTALFWPLGVLAVALVAVFNIGKGLYR